MQPGYSKTVTTVLSAILCVGSLAGCTDRSEVPGLAEANADSNASAPSSDCIAVEAGQSHREVWLEDATVIIGTNNGYPEEGPATEVDVAGFWMDIHEVTNAQFAEFVRQTGYVTTAEQFPDPEQYPDIPTELLKPGSAVFAPPAKAGGHWTQWWQFKEGANWRAPNGPGSNLEGADNHPVTHVSYLDASAYATWRGRSLPTEAQWERAAQIRTMADKAVPGANTWQGFFPLQNKATDGFRGSAPVGCYLANEKGLYDMIGNVWEWVSDRYQPRHSASSLLKSASHQGAGDANAPGESNVHHRIISESGLNKSVANKGKVNNDAVNNSVANEGHSARQPALATVRVVKGGSYLCAANYCQRDRAQARQPQEEDFGSIHIGFRTVRNQSPAR